MRRVLVLLLTFSATLLQAQERPPATQKPVPEPRRLEPASPAQDVKVPSATDQDRQQPGNLPTIDLPEFVITGIVSIDLPEVDKEGPDEHLERLAPEFRNPFAADRDRETIELTVNEKTGFEGPLDESFSGRALASIGTYRTPRIGLWLGRQTEEYHTMVEGGYQLTEGYAPFTKRTKGVVGLEGGITLNSPLGLLQGGIFGGSASYGSETYRFFGSRTPDATRSVSIGSLGMSLRNESGGSPFEYELAMGFSNLSVTDSTTVSTENRFDATFNSAVPVGIARILGSLRFSTITAAGGGLPYGEASVGSSILWWGRFYVQPAVHAYFAEGMANQKLGRVYPHLLVGVRVSERTTLSATYRGKISYTTLGARLAPFPYLSTTTLLRHADVPVDALVSLETDWDAVWRTRFSSRYQSIKGHPLYTDLLASPGMGRLFYGGTTTLAAYRTEVFAKFSANSYFAFGLTVQSTKNSVTEGRIPYVSDFEIAGSYYHTFPFGLTVSPRLQFVDRRVVDIVSGAKLPEYWLAGLRLEYALWSPLDVFLDLHNLTDRKYEEWRGYRAAPFMMHAGISYRW
ncbi:MAG: TonB-dependent receptor [Bacteroidota bacterium]